MIVKKSSLLSIFALLFLFTESNTVNAKIVSGMCFDQKMKKQSKLYASSAGKKLKIGDTELDIKSIDTVGKFIIFEQDVMEFLLPKSGGPLSRRIGGKETKTELACMVKILDDGYGPSAVTEANSSLALGCITRFQMYADSSVNLFENNDPDFQKKFANGALETTILGLEDIRNAAWAKYPAKDWDAFWKQQQMQVNLNTEKNNVFLDTMVCLNDLRKNKIIQ